MDQGKWELADAMMPGTAKWNREPFQVVDSIPMFAGRDKYVENYEAIAADHIKNIKPGSANPWIPDSLWLELEESTIGLIRKYAKAGDDVLDVGVGLGRILAQCPNLHRYGVDISLDYLRVARDAGVEVAFARVEDLPCSDNSFDLIVCCDVLEHVFDLNKACSEILRVLKPGGILIVRVPNQEEIDVYLNDDLPYEFVHLRNFDLAGIRLLFSKIFNCQYLESLPSGVFLQGPPRLRLRPLTSARLSALSELLADAETIDHPLEVLKKATCVSEEEFYSWIRDLQNNDSELYRKVALELIIPIDLNVVFRK